MITKIKNKLRHFFALSLSDKTRILVIFLLLGISRMVILTIPFRYYAKYLGSLYGTSVFAPVLTTSQTQRARQLGWMVRATANITPWESKCLAQAMTASFLLRREKIPYVMHFGLARKRNATDSDTMNAHAWIISGSVAVTGGRSYPHFGVVGTYGSPNLMANET